MRPATRGEASLDAGKAVRVSVRCRQPPASIASCPRRRDLPLPKTVKRAITTSKLPEIWRKSVNNGGKT
jgi:hypothetical protein